MRRLIALATVAVIAAVVVVIAATTGGGSQPQAAAYSAGGAAPRPATGTVALAKTPLGSVLVDSRGRTLYLFEADKPGMSACSGSCASVWPPLTATSALHAGAGLNAAQLGKIAGTGQVTYNGHPLYTYAGDTKPGATTGQGLDQFGAEWYVVNAAGNKVDED